MKVSALTPLFRPPLIEPMSSSVSATVNHQRLPIHELLASLKNASTAARIFRPTSERQSELDMLLGFFLMNGVCVFFFLLFGMCVIFSCLRRRPAFLSPPAQHKDRLQLPFTLTPVATPAPQQRAPLFRTLISKAIKSPEFGRMKVGGGESANGEATRASTSAYQQVPTSTPTKRKEDVAIRLDVLNSNRTTTDSSEYLTEDAAKSSVIRQNLLGPLSFDDLYYT